MANKGGVTHKDKIPWVALSVTEDPSVSKRQIMATVNIYHGYAYHVSYALVKNGLLKVGNFIRKPKKVNMTLSYH